MSESKETKEITIFPTITSLLKPTTDYLAEELKETVKAKVESKKKQKEEENLLSHISSVNDKINSSGKGQVSYEQLDLFSDWVDSVSKVDPVNKELSQLWQNLLVNASTENSSEILISKIKTISPGQAKALVAFADNSKKGLSEEERYYLKTLEENELIQSNNNFLTIMQFALGGSFLVFAYFILQFAVIDGVIATVLTDKKIDLTKLIVYLMPIVGYFTVFIFVVKSLQKSGKWAKKVKKLTWIGSKLVSMTERS